MTTWKNNWRQEIWEDIQQDWDILIIGGGITGAGILREATRAGLKALLVEQHDFSYGTSSRSSKLVHGGLRYLKEGRIGLTRASVLERERLRDAAPGLVDPIGFLFANPKGEGQTREWLMLEAGLSVYDLLALQWSHRYYEPQELRMLAPHVRTEDLAGAFHYGDAQTDDSRLVLRVLLEAVYAGGTAVNYVSAARVIREEEQVVGAVLRDNLTETEKEVRAKLVINATGAWVDKLREQIGGEKKIRPLRGSHLVFPQWRFPVAQAISFGHPLDGRPVMIYPWDGVTLVGTTDLDHQESLDLEPHISGQEVAYLMAAVEAYFPSLGITLDDIISTYAGVRPVVDTGQEDPSKESRDHVVWQEDGLLSVTGGKLTTFRLIALDALGAAVPYLPKFEINFEAPAVDEIVVDLPRDLPEEIRRRLIGRYGRYAAELVEAAHEGELHEIPGTTALWAELRWAARAEGVVHLEDLLLRRVRLGLLLPHGGAQWVDRIRAICQPELGWDDGKWAAEWADYQAVWQRNYSLPAQETIPNWHYMLAEIDAEPEVEDTILDNRNVVASLLLGLAAVVFAIWYFGQREKRVVDSGQ